MVVMESWEPGFAEFWVFVFAGEFAELGVDGALSAAGDDIDVDADAKVGDVSVKGGMARPLLLLLLVVVVVAAVGDVMVSAAVQW